MTWSHRHKRFVEFGNLDLEMVQILEIIINFVLIAFFLVVKKSSEICSIRKMLIVLRCYINAFDILIKIQSFNASADILYIVGSESVVSMFSIEFKYT